MKNTLFFVSAVAVLFSCANPSTSSEGHANSTVLASTVIQTNFPVAVKEGGAKLTALYINLKDQLVESNFDGAQAEAVTFINAANAWKVDELDAAQKMKLSTKLDALKESLVVFGTAMDTKGQRKAFKAINEQYTNLIKESGMTNTKLYQQFCSMAFDDEGAYWLSKDSTIRNPYFGDDMLECGEVTATYQFK